MAPSIAAVYFIIYYLVDQFQLHFLHRIPYFSMKGEPHFLLAFFLIAGLNCTALRAWRTDVWYWGVYSNLGILLLRYLGVPCTWGTTTVLSCTLNYPGTDTGCLRLIIRTAEVLGGVLMSCMAVVVLHVTMDRRIPKTPERNTWGFSPNYKVGKVYSQCA